MEAAINEARSPFEDHLAHMCKVIAGKKDPPLWWGSSANRIAAAEAKANLRVDRGQSANSGRNRHPQRKDRNEEISKDSQS